MHGIEPVNPAFEAVDAPMPVRKEMSNHITPI
jgi:hypothetical protein